MKFKNVDSSDQRIKFKNIQLFSWFCMTSDFIRDNLAIPPSQADKLDHQNTSQEHYLFCCSSFVYVARFVSRATVGVITHVLSRQHCHVAGRVAFRRGRPTDALLSLRESGLVALEVRVSVISERLDRGAVVVLGDHLVEESVFPPQWGFSMRWLRSGLSRDLFRLSGAGRTTRVAG